MSGPILVCFAVPQEAKPFRKWARAREDIEVILTGMGAQNAENSVRVALERFSPQRVFSCGFAGALDSSLRVADVVFDSKNTPPEVALKLVRLKAAPITFHCSPRVAVTAAEKSELRKQTGAGAVEMESAAIQALCAARGVNCVTLRAISDTAEENLPLDFNALMTVEQKLSSAKLALAIVKFPQKIPALIRLGQNSAAAACKLSRVLISALEASP